MVDNITFSRLEELVRQRLIDSPRCHDIDHTLRVLNIACHIAEREGGNLFIIKCAALLHDIGRSVEFADKGETCHAAIGAEEVPRILKSIGISDLRTIASIRGCVSAHRYRNRQNRNKPLSIEEKIIFDADKLDSMGAIGIGRAFHFAGRIGARVHNTEAEALQGANYGPQDSAFREYLVKLRHLKNSLMTDEGRRLGEKRSRFMHDFFCRLQKEVTGEDY